MAAFSAIRNAVTVYTGSVPTFAVDGAAKDAYFEFCRDSWTVNSKESGQSPLTITPPAQCLLNEIILVADLNGARFDDREWFIEGNVVTVLNHSDDISVTYSVLPSAALNAFDDDVFNRYSVALAKGTAAKLCLMPNKSWSDPNLGLKLQQEFISEIRKAKRNVLDKHSGNRLPRSRSNFY